MEFLEPSEKIVTLRKKLGLKQYEFETENFTRGYLGLIESKRRKLTKPAADIITAKFRKVIEERGLDIVIDDNYFMRTPEEDAIKYCTDIIENSSQRTEEEIDAILPICDSFKLMDLKAKAYMIKGRKKVECNNYDEAYINFLKASNATTTTTDIELKGRIYNNLGFCRVNQTDYKGALEYFKLAKDNYELVHASNLLSNTIYNISICLIKLNKYDKALEYVDSSLNSIDKKTDFVPYINRMITKGLCYKKLKQYDKTVIINNELIDYIKYIHNEDKGDFLTLDQRLNTNEKECLANVYTNLGGIYIELDKIQKALDYYKEAERIRESIHSMNLCHVQIEEAKLYLKWGNQDTKHLALSYAESSLKNAELYEDNEYIVLSYEVLIDYYNYVKDNKKAITCLEELLQVLIQIGDYKKAISTNNKLIEIYTNLKDINAIQRCNSNISEYLQYIKNN